MMRPIVLTLSLLLASCATTRTQSGTRITTAYRFECNPRDATLIVDEHIEGQCVLWEQRPLGLGPGPHRVRVEREGYLAHEAEISGDGPRGTLRIQLRERPE